MEVQATPLAGVLLITPRVFGDDRGHFFESYNQRELEQKAGLRPAFVQDNQSRSQRGVLRGLHYQNPSPQGKLVRVLEGEIFDVAVDLRRSSQTFRRWFGVKLSGANRQTLWIPEGFAHGFLVLSDYADVLYKTTDFYTPEHERTIAWNDPDIGIEWPLSGAPVLSAKDAAGTPFRNAELFA
jgi:dTDP-4-dehydrorhamnose 3,5-epimerase